MVTLTGHEQGPACDLRSRRLTVVIIAVVVATALMLVLSSAASAAEATNPKLLQEYTAVVDSLGRAHVTDVYNYDPTFFSQHVGEFNDHPSVLTRDLQQQVAMGSVVNLTKKVDPDTSTVTLTYDTPGYAINMGDHWEIPSLGGSSPPTTTSDSSVVFEEMYAGASSLTAWQTNDWTWRQTVKLPAGASGATWDDGQKQVAYKLAYVPPAPPKTFLQQNKVFLAPLFAILAIATVGGMVIVLKRGGVAAAPAIGPAADRRGIATPDIVVIAAPAQQQVIEPPAQQQVIEPAPAADAVTQSSVVEPPAAPATALPRFCPSCGFAVASDAHFCVGCGKALTSL